MGERAWALGLMSGTSLDGVDGAMLLGDGEAVAGFGASAYVEYTPDERRVLRAALAQGAQMSTIDLRRASGAFAQAEAVLHSAHLRCIETVLARSEHRPALIGFHGQTVMHRPQERFTLQIGDAARLAQATGLPVVHDFRTRDVASGGQGAPLVPFFHHALARGLVAAGTIEAAPIAFLNIGGVANVTWVDPRMERPEAPGALLAFDTGPGNAQLNDWMMSRCGLPFDAEGAVAARGEVDRAALGYMLEAGYLAARPPKSLDRTDFDPPEGFASLSTEDGAATLSALTVGCIVRAQRWFPEPVQGWTLCGGGRKNAHMMAELAQALDAPLISPETLELDGDMIEAQCFAHLALRSAAGLALSAPGTTGVAEPVSGGLCARPTG
ncbi:MAG: anhydro-N-acetylmuramic acid kinase [Neomegalonema sp.]|nr:anhydro-N-acetylmuramic acid kinase [Neomegalonema sp.]